MQGRSGDLAVTRRMTAGGSGKAGALNRAADASVLADRMAAALVHHEPGWRLPRRTALARRYRVSTAEVDAAIDELAGRHLVRRLPGGQVYRVSPAEYLVPLEGVFGLVSRVDPMGGQFACRSWSSSRRRPPEDIGRSLGLAAGVAAIAVRCLWTVGGEPAALSASYVAESFAAAQGQLPTETNGAGARPAGGNGGPGGEGTVAIPGQGGAPGPASGYRAGEDQVPGEDQAPGDVHARGGQAAPPLANFLVPWSGEGAAAARPQAVQLEMALPPPSAARSLRMTAAEPVATVTVSFADPATAAPVALTMAMLRPQLFRILITAPGSVPAGSTGGSGTAWTHMAEGWEP
jgi:hypothetical protein